MKLNSNVRHHCCIADCFREKTKREEKQKKTTKKKKKNGTRDPSVDRTGSGEEGQGAESKPSSLLRYIVLARISGSYEWFAHTILRKAWNCACPVPSCVHTTNEYNEYRCTRSLPLIWEQFIGKWSRATPFIRQRRIMPAPAINRGSPLPTRGGEKYRKSVTFAGVSGKWPIAVQWDTRFIDVLPRDRSVSATCVVHWRERTKDFSNSARYTINKNVS